MQSIIESIKRLNGNHADVHPEVDLEMNKIKWAFYRIVFIGWCGLSALTGVSGLLGAPISSYYFFGTWRFWKHWSPGWRMVLHTYRMIYLTMRGDFVVSIPLTGPPTSEPDRGIVKISPDWEHGESCGACGVCCELIKCPLMEKERRICLGYNSFFWRYFNCGRFPSNQREIDHYSCPKWLMKN